MSGKQVTHWKRYLDKIFWLFFFLYVVELYRENTDEKKRKKKTKTNKGKTVLSFLYDHSRRSRDRQIGQMSTFAEINGWDWTFRNRQASSICSCKRTSLWKAEALLVLLSRRRISFPAAFPSDSNFCSGSHALKDSSKTPSRWGSDYDSIFLAVHVELPVFFSESVSMTPTSTRSIRRNNARLPHLLNIELETFLDRDYDTSSDDLRSSILLEKTCVPVFSDDRRAS